MISGEALQHYWPGFRLVEIDAELLDEANAVFWKKEYAARLKQPRVLLPDRFCL